jgi:hypothetical protein
MAEFDVKSVTPIEWTGIGAGVLAFIASFFSWASYSFSFLGSGPLASVSYNAWDVGALAWLAVFLLIGAAVVVILPHFGVQVPNRALIWLILSGVATVFILLRLITLGTGIGPSFGIFVALVIALASAVAAFLTFRGSSSSSHQA